MIVAIDALYRDNSARVAAVVFKDWTSEEASARQTLSFTHVSEYIPGQFYQRELEPILSILKKLETIHTIVIDGYCHLDKEGKKGLGAHLYDATKGQYTIIGVAKNPFMGSPHAACVYRGESKKPLYVTSIGISKETAANYISKMAGNYRMPNILKEADSMSRNSSRPKT